MATKSDEVPAKQETTQEMIELGQELSARVLDRSLSKNKALQIFKERLRLPKNRARTATGYCECYLYLLTGKKFRNTISEAGWRYNLEKVGLLGHESLRRAMYVFSEHMGYLKGINKLYPALHGVHADFTAQLASVSSATALDVKFELDVQIALRESEDARTERLQSTSGVVEKVVVQTTIFRRNPVVVATVLSRAKGLCESCRQPAPFARANGQPYLEVHHIKRLADGGLDLPSNALALCPNCHRERHFGAAYSGAPVPNT